TKYLVEWMLSHNLDLFNETRLATVNPVEMMVRGSLDFGVQAVVSITFGELEFVDSKRKRVKDIAQAAYVKGGGAKDIPIYKLGLYTKPYVTEVVPPRMVYPTKRMTSRIRSAFEKALKSASWIGRDIRDELINKLIDVKFYVGSQGRRLNPAFVEEVYSESSSICVMKGTEITAASLFFQ
ncbi:hypothetical protein MTO96_047174, partial [Rhipicephalus appendiculatus]